MQIMTTNYMDYIKGKGYLVQTGGVFRYPENMKHIDDTV